MQEYKGLVSVVLPVYKSERFLPEAIASILGQSHTNLELLAVYDQSGDGSFDILQQAALSDKRIKLIKGRARGLPDALNLGIEASKGEYIARMDADDISDKERFRKQIDRLQESETDICGCNFLVINEIGNAVDAKIVSLTDEKIKLILGFTVPFAHGSVMMRADFLRAKNLRYKLMPGAEDYALWIDCINNGAKFSNVNDFLFKYRRNHESLINTNRKKTKVCSNKCRKLNWINNKNTYKNLINYSCKNYKNFTNDEVKYLVAFTLFLAIRLLNFRVFQIAKNIGATKMVMGMHAYWRG